MKNKAMEFAERHVEKVVLAASILFVGWIAYNNFVGSPNSVHLSNGSGPKVAPSRVGSKITEAVDNLWQQIEKAGKVEFNRIHRVNYVAHLQMSQLSPLPHEILAMSSGRFAPYNTGIEATGLQQIKGLVFRAPKVPVLAVPTAMQARGVAELSSSKTKDVVWVKLSSTFPTKKWLESMTSRVGLKANEEPLPAAYRQTVFYRVQVRRQSLQPDGEWGPWKLVKGTYLQALPAVQMSALGPNGRMEARSGISSAQQEITNPAFYTIEQIRQRIIKPTRQPTIPHPVFHQPNGGGGGGPPSFLPPGMPFTGGGGGFAPPNIQQMMRAQQRAMREQQMQARAAAQRALAAQQAQQAQPATGYGLPVLPQFNGMQPNGNGLQTALAAKADVPLRFYDASVTPGKTYRYEMRVEMVNPVYKVGFHVTDPSIIDRPWLTGDWSDPSARVQVNANLYFYLISGQIFNDQVDFRIFKWVHGVWAVTSEYVSPGEPIGNEQSIPMVDPATGNLKATMINFDTHYQLVDAKPAANGSINVVVLSPLGQLEIRNSEIDATDPEQQKLIKATMETGSPSGVAPASSGAGTAPAP